MADTGWITPGTGSSIDIGGDVAWTNPGNILADDGSFATCSLSAKTASPDSQGLQGTNFGFDAIIGASDTIDGIEFRFSRYEGAPGGPLTDSLIQLVIGGTPTGDNKSSGAGWPSTETISSAYGGASDTWGASPSASDVRASDFGVVIGCTQFGGSGSGATVDHFEMKVYYTSAGPSANPPAARHHYQQQGMS